MRKPKSKISMNKLTLSITAIAILLSPSLCHSAQSPADADLTAKVQAVLQQCKELHAGDTREKLLRMFTTEGGISTARQRTYVHRRCLNIKVDVEFTLSAPDQNDERPTDKITKISRPYLADTVID